MSQTTPSEPWAEPTWNAARRLRYVTTSGKQLMIQARWAMAHAKKAGKPRIACRTRCTYCCRRDVKVTKPEVEAIAQALLKCSDSVLYAVGRRLEYQANPRRPVKAAALPMCPLLSDTHRCLVYKDRPLACRSVHSISVNACSIIATKRQRDPSLPFDPPTDPDTKAAMDFIHSEYRRLYVHRILSPPTGRRALEADSAKPNTLTRMLYREFKRVMIAAGRPTP